MENYPVDQGCYTANGTGGPRNRLYARKHNPFMSFNNIRNNPARCALIQSSSALYQDISAKSVPQYVFYTPNQNNDMHDTNTTFGSQWLKSFLEPLRKDAYFADTLFLITFGTTN
jgi:Phosphoesterase family